MSGAEKDWFAYLIYLQKNRDVEIILIVLTISIGLVSILNNVNFFGTGYSAIVASTMIIVLALMLASTRVAFTECESINKRFIAKILIDEIMTGEIPYEDERILRRFKEIENNVGEIIIMDMTLFFYNMKSLESLKKKYGNFKDCKSHKKIRRWECFSKNSYFIVAQILIISLIIGGSILFSIDGNGLISEDIQLMAAIIISLYVGFILHPFINVHKKLRRHFEKKIYDENLKEKK